MLGCCLAHAAQAGWRMLLATCRHLMEVLFSIHGDGRGTLARRFDSGISRRIGYGKCGQKAQGQKRHFMSKIHVLLAEI
jgi:hypothetical protein